jgi:PAS domain S-box-containing protein
MSREDNMKPARNLTEATKRQTGRVFLLLFALLAAAFGFLALLGWVLALPWLTSFGAGLIPMAPSTALLFLMCGASVAVRARTPLSRRAFWISVAAGSLIALVALLLFVLSCLDIHPAVEHLVMNISDPIGGAPRGHISPIIAFCFLLASVSFLASLSKSATRSWRAALAISSAGVLLATCLILLLVYLYGVLLPFGGTFIPPALNTSLAFAMLGLALLALADWPPKLSRGLPADGFRNSFAFALFYFLLAVGIVTGGWIYYLNSQRNHRTQIEDQLSAIADLKVGELVHYRKERLADGAVLFKNEPLSALVRRFLGKTEDAEAQRQIQIWLGKYLTHYGYDEIRLLDAQGVTRLSLPAGLPTVSASVAKSASSALRSGQVTLADFYRSDNDQRIHLGVLVPILDEQDANRPLGIFFLRIDPAAYLYPLIQRWPTPSESAETLLVRKEGNEAIFLNELRFQTNTALNLRTPLDRLTMPAVQAALGREGIWEGTDYRGVPVLAALRTVPGSPWALVARMDTAEVNAPVRNQLWQIVVLIGVLLLGAGAGVGLVWVSQRAAAEMERQDAAAALRESEKLLSQFVKHSPVYTFIKEVTPGRSRVLVASENFVDLTGLPGSQMIGKTMEELFPLELAVKMTADDWAVISGNKPLQLEETLRNRHYTTIKYPIALEDKTFLAGFTIDITGRKNAEEAAALSSQRTAMLLSLSQMMNATFQQIAGYALEEAVLLIKSSIGYLAFLNEDESVLTMYSWSKTAMAECAIIDKPLVYPVASTGLWGEAVRQRRPVITNDCAAANPLKKGCPQGHVAVKRHMNVPVFDGDRTVLVAGVGNKVEEYDQDDAQNLTLIMEGVWRLLERKRSEEEKARLEGQLQQAQKMETVGQLAGGVAHDFNNMLQVILSYVEMSLSKVEAGQPLQKYLLEIQRAARRSAEITGQLLAFARKQTVSPKVLEFNGAVAQAQKMIQRLIGEDISLAWMPGHDLWKVKIDPAQLDQILANLAVNARDAIGGVGKLTIETANVSLDEAYCAAHVGFVPGEYSLLAVSDDGCGMDKETLSHLFEPFFTTKEQGKGTGLGLATVYGIVKQNNGFITVYSEPGEGTTFRVYLPRAEGAPGADAQDMEALTPRGGTETVLVVEDEAAILQMAQLSLQQLGYTVLTASSPEEGLRRSEEHAGPIQLLITDVVMPQMNGRQLAERLSAVRPQLKCLYMSGYTADVIAHRGVLEEGVSFISKPFSLTTLAAKVREVLDHEP